MISLFGFDWEARGNLRVAFVFLKFKYLFLLNLLDTIVYILEEVAQTEEQKTALSQCFEQRREPNRNKSSS